MSRSSHNTRFRSLTSRDTTSLGDAVLLEVTLVQGLPARYRQNKVVIITRTRDTTHLLDRNLVVRLHLGIAAEEGVALRRSRRRTSDRRRARFPSHPRQSFTRKCPRRSTANTRRKNITGNLDGPLKVRPGAANVWTLALATLNLSSRDTASAILGRSAPSGNGATHSSAATSALLTTTPSTVALLPLPALCPVTCRFVVFLPIPRSGEQNYRRTRVEIPRHLLVDVPHPVACR